ncbi:MAG: GNAT family N-acyltransferase [Pseudomonadota bacterium]
MGRLLKGRYVARFAKNEADVQAAQRLRYLAFIADTTAAARADGVDADRFDDICRHVLIEDRKTGRLVCCFRLLPIEDGAQISKSYAAQHYELSALEGYQGRMVEMGRFCILPSLKDPDIIRTAWAAMSRYVDETGTDMLFGCSSFQGTDATGYRDAFAMLKERHLAPKRWLPKVKAPDVFRFARFLRKKADAKRAMLTMPPLLRGYLAMGGWVSDHAVVDRDLGTLHVFTGLEISAIPPARKRLLRASAV